ncbi:MAG: diguanylate cyclase domain-containing protein [Nitriliruptoraceae bacterium]
MPYDGLQQEALSERVVGSVVGAQQLARSLEATPAQVLARIIALAPIGVGLVDAQGRTVLANEALGRMLGYSPEEFARLHFREFTHPQDQQHNDELFEELMAGRIDRFDLDKRFFHRDGHVVWGRLLVAAMRDEHGERLAIGLLQDVTEEKRLQAELAAAEASYRQMVEEVPAVVYLTDAGADIAASYVSPRIEELLGYTPQEWYATPGLWRSLLYDADRAEVLSDLDAHRDSGATVPLTLTYRMRHKDGSLVWIRDQCRFQEDDAGRPFRRGVLVDVTREKELEAELEHLAFHDPLTHLANLRLFRLRTDDRLRRRPPRTGAVLFVDLDEFKPVNDRYGHGVGDRLLAEAARRVRASLRDADTAGRLGGDEFAVLLDEVDDRDTALMVAERLRLRLSEPYDLSVGDGPVRVGASIGVAMLTDGEGCDGVLRAADLAMYAAKEDGKGAVRPFEPWMLEAVLAQPSRSEEPRSSA